MHHVTDMAAANERMRQRQTGVHTHAARARHDKLSNLNRPCKPQGRNYTIFNKMSISSRPTRCHRKHLYNERTLYCLYGDHYPVVGLKPSATADRREPPKHCLRIATRLSCRTSHRQAISVPIRATIIRRPLLNNTRTIY